MKPLNYQNLIYLIYLSLDHSRCELTMIKHRIIKVLIPVLFLPVSTNAADVTYSAGILLSQYSNVNRVPNPTDTETSYTLIAGLTAIEDTADFSMYIDGNVRSINYTKGLADDRVTGDVVANLLWKISPGQLDWIVDDTFTQTSINPLQANRPSNLQNVNIFSTGPDYTIRFSATNNLIFTSRAETFRYESITINRDNNRGTVTASWSKQMNSRLNLSLNDAVEKVDYENAAINSFARNDVFLAVNYTSGIHALDGQYGYTNVKYENIDSIKYDRYLLSVSRLMSRNSSVQLSYQDMATDAGRQLVQATPGNMTTNAISNLVSNDIYVDKTSRLQYLNAAVNTSFNIDIYSRDRKYRQQTILDEESQVALLNGSWSFGQGDRIIYVASYISRFYTNSSPKREDEDILYSLRYTHRLKRNFTVGLSAIQTERDSTVSNFSYEDLTVILNLNYNSL